MIDTDGTEWLTVALAARRVRVRVETLRVWVHRGKVRQIGDFLNMVDIMEAEHAWRVRLAKANYTPVICDSVDTRTQNQVERAG